MPPVGSLRTVSDRKVFRVVDVEKSALVDAVKEVVNSDLSSRMSATVAAREFYISPRTFVRRLSSFGLSYKNIADDVRKEHAIEFLEKTNLKVAEIAIRLGYANSSNFSKAFKSWTGLPPKEYRETIQAS